jgi:hypothetical protein
MNKVFIALTLLTFTSCSQDGSVETKKTLHKIGNRPVSIVKIEGCEYFLTDYGQSALFCHKGNCNNSIHKFKSEQ